MKRPVIRISKVRLPLLLRVVALYAFVCVPLFAVASLQPNARVQAVATSKSAVVISESDLRVGKPQSVNVPRLGINLSIIDGVYDQTTDSWTLSDDKAQFAAVTALPNN